VFVVTKKKTQKAKRRQMTKQQIEELVAAAAAQKCTKCGGPTRYKFSSFYEKKELVPYVEYVCLDIKREPLASSLFCTQKTYCVFQWPLNFVIGLNCEEFNDIECYSQF
jgi:hypothetical protein